MNYYKLTIESSIHESPYAHIVMADNIYDAYEGWDLAETSYRDMYGGKKHKLLDIIKAE